MFFVVTVVKHAFMYKVFRGIPRISYLLSTPCGLETLRNLTTEVENKMAQQTDNKKPALSVAKEILSLTSSSAENCLKVLAEHKDKNNYVAALINTYKKEEEKLKGDHGTKSHPFVVLEGLDGSGKSTISKIVAKKLKAVKKHTPPDSIVPLRSYFDNHPILRTAYYYLGNYIAAMEIQSLLKDRPVILDRFWHSTTAYALAQMTHDYDEYELPPKGDSLYKWPADLLKPDLAIFLAVSEDVRNERHARRNLSTEQEDLLKNSLEFRNNVVTAYNNIEDPKLLHLCGDKSLMSVVYAVKAKIEPLHTQLLNMKI